VKILLMLQSGIVYQMVEMLVLVETLLTVPYKRKPHDYPAAVALMLLERSFGS
jgi:hypothetical protein